MIDQPQGEKPALTVIIQSWWTPALAVFMLVVGLLAGYFGRPLVDKGASAGELVVEPTPAAQAVEGQLDTGTPSVDATMAAISNQEQLMTYLVSNTTHFKGDPNAPVTIIEFSDFQ